MAQPLRKNQKIGTDSIVLACTHYPFLKADFVRLAPWPVEWIDPAPAIARRVVSVVGVGEGGATGGGLAYLTSGKPWPETLVAVLGQMGLEPMSEPASG